MKPVGVRRSGACAAGRLDIRLTDEAKPNQRTTDELRSLMIGYGAA